MFAGTTQHALGCALKAGWLPLVLYYSFFEEKKKNTTKTNKQKSGIRGHKTEVLGKSETQLCRKGVRSLENFYYILQTLKISRISLQDAGALQCSSLPAKLCLTWKVLRNKVDLISNKAKQAAVTTFIQASDNTGMINRQKPGGQTFHPQHSRWATSAAQK